MKNFKLISALFLLLIIALHSCEKNEFATNKTSTPVPKPKVYFISDATGSDNNIGTSQAAAFKTIAKAAVLTQPGDSVYIMQGNYTITSTLNIVNSGKAGQFITYAALPGSSPKLVCSGNLFNAVVINASYIKFEGIEMQGDNANLTLVNATSAYNAAVAGGAANGTYNMNGINVGPTSKTATVFPSHIEVRNCIVHDFPALGIGAVSADYVTIERNRVYNNSWYTMYATSGISMVTPWDSDNSTTGYRFVVRGNICYNNKTQVPWINTKALSDGNGIIIDVNTITAGNGPAYKGRTLVENNVSFNNGGSGIHAFSSGHVDIVNNTAYNNGQVVGYADIYASYANDCKVINNIAYAKNGGRTNNITNNTNVTYDYNVYYNSTNIVGMGAHDIIADPQFINLSTNPAVANFQLKASSPAVNAGTSTLFSAKDFSGIARPKGSAPDCGAYESF